MKNTERALANINKAISEVSDEIARLDDGQQGVISNAQQLQKFLSQLEAMRDEVSENSVSGNLLGMGRVIVDSWPFDSPLGATLLAAEQSYKSLVG